MRQLNNKIIASLPETGLIKEPALNAEQVEEYERL